MDVIIVPSECLHNNDGITSLPLLSYCSVNDQPTKESTQQTAAIIIVLVQP